jgi:hypothetical protein
MRIYGDPLAGRYKAINGTLITFLESVITLNQSACIDWPFGQLGNHNKSDIRYGQINFRGRKMAASRAALILSTGLDPDDMDACHSCNRKICVNVLHLRWDSKSANQMDRIADGTSNQGTQNGQSKLTNSQVLSIYVDKRNTSEIAAQYGMSAHHIRKIKRGHKWGWLTCGHVT